MGVRDYKALLLNLLPTGLAWPRNGADQRDAMLDAFAVELDRVDSRVGNMLDEADPRTALETLPDWERITGLPDECVFCPQPDHSGTAEPRGAEADRHRRAIDRIL